VTGAAGAAGRAATWEGRIVLTDEVLAAAEEACWDTVTARPPV